MYFDNIFPVGKIMYLMKCIYFSNYHLLSVISGELGNNHISPIHIYIETIIFMSSITRRSTYRLRLCDSYLNALFDCSLNNL